MQNTTLSDFFSTTRDFFKWVVDEDRKLSKVPPFTPPVDYSPNSGDRLGILVEPESTNLYIDSEGLSAGVINSSGVSRSTTSVIGSDYSIKIPSNKGENTTGSDITINDAGGVAISFYVLQTNLQRPKVGYTSNENTTISIRIDGRDPIIPISDIDVQGPMNDLSYRVRVRTPLISRTMNNIEIVKPSHSAIGMNISKIQVEENHWTSYIPTTGQAETRQAETVFRNLTHEKDFNEDQGAYDVFYSPTPGSYGSAMTLLKDDWTEYIAVGHQENDNGNPELARLHTSSRVVPITLRAFDKEENIRGGNSGIRVSYSGYGARTISRDGGSIQHLKDYNSFRQGKLNRIQFGESFEGHFCGHIHMINGYLRSLTDEEMKDFTYVPNDSSDDPDKDLEEPSIVETAAAIFRTDEEALLYQNVVEPPTPQRVLAAWPRASQYRYFPDPSNIPPTSDPANTWSAGRWYYNGNINAFVQPINSNRFEQIFSPIKIDTYEFEATMYADPNTPGYWNDDDGVGLIAASDIIGGDLVTVSVLTHSGGLGGPRFSIRLTDGSRPDLGKFYNITGNNVLYKRKTPAGGRTGLYTRIKITRAGAFLKAVATRWNDLDNYQEDYELVVNMNSIPGKGKLLANRPARYGFCTYSNTGSTYLDYVIRSDQAINDLKIYSLESGKYWKYDNGWQLQTETAAEDLLPSTRITNTKTKEQYVIDDVTQNIEFFRNSGISENDATVSAPKNDTVDIPVQDIVDQFVLEGEDLFLFNIYNEDNLIAEQITLSGETYIRLVTNNTNGEFVVLVGTEPETDAFGITNETIAFRHVKVEV